MSELLTSLDVVNQSFKKSLRGYDAAEVDEFLDHVAETLQFYNQRTKELERDLAAKQDALAEYDRMKDVLHEALLMAQKSADDRVKSAREQANKIISDAKEQADAMCREAAGEAERLRAGVEQIRNIRDMYAQEFRGILAKFDNQLNQAMNSQLGGAVDSVLEVREKPADEPQPEEAEEPQLKSEPGDFAAACGMLGVDPQDILK